MPAAIPHVEGVEHRDVVVDGVRLHVAEAGEGQPVILQHGWPQHWYSWRYLIGPLAERYRVICPDLRGFGWSAEPADGNYRKERIVDDLIGLCSELGHERIRYVGHDWGGFAGFLLGIRRPDLVERAMILSCPPPWPPPGRPDPRKLTRLAYQLPLAAPGIGPIKPRLFEQILRRARVDGDWTPTELEIYLERLRQPAQVRASTGLYRTFLLHEAKGIAMGAYNDRRLEVPTKLLFGRQDLIHDDELVEAAQAHADDLTSETFEGAGHFLPEERPDEVRERVLEFLAG